MPQATAGSEPLRGLRPGFSLLEAVIALIVIGVVLGGAMIMLSTQRRTAGDTQFRAVAEILARNEIEALRAAGPEHASDYVGTSVVNSAGEPDAQGQYHMTVSTYTTCDGGAQLADNATELRSIDNSSCGNGRNAMLAYRIHLQFPGGPGRDTITYDLRLNATDRFAGTRAGN